MFVMSDTTKYYANNTERAHKQHEARFAKVKRFLCGVDNPTLSAQSCT